jgi:hypothetical protein
MKEEIRLSEATKAVANIVCFQDAQLIFQCTCSLQESLVCLLSVLYHCKAPPGIVDVCNEWDIFQFHAASEDDMKNQWMTSKSTSFLNTATIFDKQNAARSLAHRYPTLLLR